MDVHVRSTFVRPPKSGRLFRFSLSSVLLLIVACSVPLSSIPLFRNSVGQNVSREDAPIWGLPGDASNVSYFIHGAFGPLRLYEFDTSENSFREWVGRFNVEPKADEHFRILQYAGSNNGPFAVRYVDIENGLVYRRVAGDSGVHMAYDLEMGRAYYFSHSR